MMTALGRAPAAATGLNAPTPASDREDQGQRRPHAARDHPGADAASQTRLGTRAPVRAIRRLLPAGASRGRTRRRWAVADRPVWGGTGTGWLGGTSGTCAGTRPSAGPPPTGTRLDWAPWRELGARGTLADDRGSRAGASPTSPSPSAGVVVPCRAAVRLSLVSRCGCTGLAQQDSDGSRACLDAAAALSSGDPAVLRDPTPPRSSPRTGGAPAAPPPHRASPAAWEGESDPRVAQLAPGVERGPRHRADPGRAPAVARR